MTVQQLFETDKIDKEFLFEKMQGQSSYWDSAVNFVIEKWTTDIESLSPRQAKWLTSILDDCVEKRIEG